MLIGHMLFIHLAVPTKAIFVAMLISIVLMMPVIHGPSHNSLLSINVDVDVERFLSSGVRISEQLTHSHHNASTAVSVSTQRHAYHQDSTASSPEHQHAHNSGEHSHNFFFLSANNLATVNSLGFWPYAYQRNHLSHTAVQWQRPPRHTPL